MSRRLSWIAVLSAAFMFLATVPAAAVGPFGPAESLVIGGCTDGVGDAAIAVDGTTRGFANCTGLQLGADLVLPRRSRDRRRSGRSRPTSGWCTRWPGMGRTPPTWCSRPATELKIGKRIESSGAYSPLTTLTPPGRSASCFTADVVASNGQWWTVWSEHVGPAVRTPRRAVPAAHPARRAGPDPDHHHRRERRRQRADAGLRQRAGDDGVDPRPQPCSGPSQADLWIAESTGGAWSSRPFASLGDLNDDADITIYGGVTWVTWTRDNRIFVANNSGGTFHSRTFAAPGFGPTVAVSGSHVFVAWYATDADRVVLAELSGGIWTSGQVAGARSYPLRVLAQGTKARVVSGGDVSRHRALHPHPDLTPARIEWRGPPTAWSAHDRPENRPATPSAPRWRGRGLSGVVLLDQLGRRRPPSPAPRQTGSRRGARRAAAAAAPAAGARPCPRSRPGRRSARPAPAASSGQCQPAPAPAQLAARTAAASPALAGPLPAALRAGAVPAPRPTPGRRARAARPRP